MLPQVSHSITQRHYHPTPSREYSNTTFMLNCFTTRINYQPPPLRGYSNPTLNATFMLNCFTTKIHYHSSPPRGCSMATFDTFFHADLLPHSTTLPPTWPPPSRGCSITTFDIFFMLTFFPTQRHYHPPCHHLRAAVQSPFQTPLSCYCSKSGN